MIIDTVQELEPQKTSQDSKQPRKRNRVPVACNVCRKRKVRCDRGRPHCDVCQKYNVAHLCFYQEPSWSHNSFRKMSESSQERPKLPTVIPDFIEGPNAEAKKDRLKVDKADIEWKPSEVKPILKPVEPVGPKSSRFDNTIRNLIHHSSAEETPQNSRMLGFDDHTSFNKYQNYNPHQSSERSTANYPPRQHVLPPVLPYVGQNAVPNDPISAPEKFIASDIQENDGASPAIQSELNRMKQKIKEIEASITLSKTFISPDDSVKQLPSILNDVDEPLLDPNETISFYENYISVNATQSHLVNHGPLSWVSLSKRDRFASLLLLKSAQISPSERLKRKRIDIIDKDLDVDTKKLKPSANLQPHDVTFALLDSQSRNEKLLLKYIEGILPDKKIIWVALERFFKYCYPFSPFVSQQLFYKEVTRLIGERSLDGISNIDLKDRLDFATIGLLLLFMRFGFLSATIHINAMSKPVDDELFHAKIGSEFADAALSCLKIFPYMKQTTISIIQLALYLGQYHNFAPEECDLLDDGIYGGLLVEMGNTLGLNRDPLSFGIDDKMVNLWRKLWVGLLLIDGRQAFALGNPPIIRDELFDTQLPHYIGERGSNHNDLEVEKGSMELITKSLHWSNQVKNLSWLILNMKTPPRLVTVFRKLKDLEALISSKFGSLNGLLTLDNQSHVTNFLKVKKIITFLELQTTVHTIYHYICIHLEEKKNYKAVLFFMGKIAKITVKIITCFLPILNNFSKIFGDGFGWYAIPKLEMVMHKTLQAQYSMIMRTEHLKHMVNNTPGFDVALKSLRHVLLQDCEIYLKGLLKLSDKFYNAWKMYKTQGVVLNILKNISEDFFTMNDSSKMEVSIGETKIAAPEYNFLTSCSPDDIDKLTKLFDTSVYKRDLPFDDNIDDESIYESTQRNLEVDRMWIEQIGSTYQDLNTVKGYFNPLDVFPDL